MAVAILLPREAAIYPKLLSCYHLRHEVRFDHLLRLKEFLEAKRANGAILVGCGWWVAKEFDYLLPGVGNFRDCRSLSSSDFRNHDVLLVKNTSYWNDQKVPVLDRFSEGCEREVVFQTGEFKVSRCREPLLTTTFDTFGARQEGINDKWP